jgi:hypothetical protein
MPKEEMIKLVNALASAGYNIRSLKKVWDSDSSHYAYFISLEIVPAPKAKDES